MKNLLLAMLIASICVVFLSGCGGYKEGMVQPDQESFIWFSGNLEAAVATIDNGAAIKLDEPSEADPKGKTLYRLKPGKHDVVVTRNGQVIVNRSIMVGSGAAKEIAVP
jgi:hypothetical protein